MRHRKAGVKLNRTSSHRNAMFRNMVTSLFKHERIRTTDTKAKALQQWADNLITLAKRGDLHARRQALAVIREKDVVHKLFNEAEEKFGATNGGYTRIVRLGTRPGDAAPISLIELISSAPEKKRKAGRKKKASDAGSKPTAEKTSATAPEKETETASKAKKADAGTVDKTPLKTEMVEPSEDADKPDAAG